MYDYVCSQNHAILTSSNEAYGVSGDVPVSTNPAYGSLKN